MRKTHLLTGLVAVASVFAVGHKASAASLITNGDFSAGNTGFSSQYAFDSSAGAGLSDPPDSGAGVYGIVASSTYWHPLFQPFEDHTQDGSAVSDVSNDPYDANAGFMMIVNGNDAISGTGLNVWSENISGLTSGDTYTLSFFATAAYDANRAVLDFTATVGSLNLSTFTVTGDAGTWYQYATTFVASGSSTTISIVDSTTNSAGNDFALDDISLDQTGEGPTIPLPASALSGTVLLAGIAITQKLRSRRQA